MHAMAVRPALTDYLWVCRREVMLGTLVASAGCTEAPAHRAPIDTTWQLEAQHLTAPAGVTGTSSYRPLNPSDSRERFVIDQGEKISAFIERRLKLGYAEDGVGMDYDSIVVNPGWLWDRIGNPGDLQEVTTAVRFALLHEFGHLLQFEAKTDAAVQSDVSPNGAGERWMREEECQADIIGAFATALQARVEQHTRATRQPPTAATLAPAAPVSSHVDLTDRLVPDFAWRIGTESTWNPNFWPTREQRGECVGAGIELGRLVAGSVGLEQSAAPAPAARSRALPGEPPGAGPPTKLPSLADGIVRVVGAARAGRNRGLARLYAWSEAKALEVVAIDSGKGSDVPRMSVREAVGVVLARVASGDDGWIAIRGRPLRATHLDGSPGTLFVLRPSFPDPWRCFAHDIKYAYCYVLRRNPGQTLNSVFDSTLRDVRASISSADWSLREHARANPDRAGRRTPQTYWLVPNRCGKRPRIVPSVAHCYAWTATRR